MDMNILLSKLKTILLQVRHLASLFKTFNLFVQTEDFTVCSNTEDGEREILRENGELKSHILLLGSQLEEKDRKIRNLENEIKRKRVNTCSTSSQTAE